MGVEGEGGSREGAGWVLKVGSGSRKEYTGIYGERVSKRKTEGRASLRAWGYERKLRRGKGGIGHIVLGKVEGESKRGDSSGGIGEGEERVL